MAIRECNITVNVSDMEKSLTFYQSIGFEVKKQWGNYYAQLTVAGITIGLHPTSETHLTGGSGNVSIGLTTENLSEAKTLLEKLSVKITARQEEGGDFLHFTDPDGTLLYFILPKW